MKILVLLALSLVATAARADRIPDSYKAVQTWTGAEAQRMFANMSGPNVVTIKDAPFSPPNEFAKGTIKSLVLSEVFSGTGQDEMETEEALSCSEMLQPGKTVYEYSCTDSIHAFNVGDTCYYHQDEPSCQPNG